jgi:hypothetical protein
LPTIPLPLLGETCLTLRKSAWSMRDQRRWLKITLEGRISIHGLCVLLVCFCMALVLFAMLLVLVRFAMLHVGHCYHVRHCYHDWNLLSSILQDFGECLVVCCCYSGGTMSVRCQYTVGMLSVQWWYAFCVLYKVTVRVKKSIMQDTFLHRLHMYII